MVGIMPPPKKLCGHCRPPPKKLCGHCSIIRLFEGLDEIEKELNRIAERLEVVEKRLSTLEKKRQSR